MKKKKRVCYEDRENTRGERKLFGKSVETKALFWLEMKGCHVNTLCKWDGISMQVRGMVGPGKITRATPARYCHGDD